jgi:hypothetical protein
MECANMARTGHLAEFIKSDWRPNIIASEGVVRLDTTTCGNGKVFGVAGVASWKKLLLKSGKFCRF